MELTATSSHLKMRMCKGENLEKSGPGGVILLPIQSVHSNVCLL